MIATRAVIAAIAEKKKCSDRSDDSDHKETTFQRSQQGRSLESGSVNMISMIAAIAELFFFLIDRSHRSDHMETRL